MLTCSWRRGSQIYGVLSSSRLLPRASMFWLSLPWALVLTTTLLRLLLVLWLLLSSRAVLLLVRAGLLLWLS